MKQILIILSLVSLLLMVGCSIEDTSSKCNILSVTEASAASCNALVDS